MSHINGVERATDSAAGVREGPGRLLDTSIEITMATMVVLIKAAGLLRRGVGDLGLGVNSVLFLRHGTR